MNKGLVISGGGANGLFALQILHNMIQDGYSLDEVKYVSGVSVGAMIGAMIVQNEFDIIYDVFPTLKNSQIYKGKFNVWWGLWNRLRGKNYVLDITPLTEFLKQYISLEKAKSSGKIFHIGVTDFSDGKYKSPTQFDFDDNDQYINAILASGSQPIIWRNIPFKSNCGTVEYGYDGGVIRVSPINDILQYHPSDIVIINNSPNDILVENDLKNTESVLLRLIDILLESSFVKDLKHFTEINQIVQRFGEYEDRRYYPYKMYQIELHNDSLDFENKDLINDRINHANDIYKKMNK